MNQSIKEIIYKYIYHLIQKLFVLNCTWLAANQSHVTCFLEFLRISDINLGNMRIKEY